MNLRTLKFAKRGNDYLTESKQAIATAFRHYINLAQPSGFSDIDTTAHPEEYTPLLYVNRDDFRNNMLYEDDVVFIELPDIYEFDKKVWRLGVVGYNEDNAAFGVYELYPEFEQLAFTAFNQISKDSSSFRLGNLHTDKEFIDKILGDIDNGVLPGEVICRILKQYTNESQTAKLIELGFEKPCSIASVEPIYGMGGISVAKAYSIGELIEMLPKTIETEIWWGKEKGEIGTWGLRIDTDGVEYMWTITYERDHSANLGVVGAGEELIDALYDMIIKLKEEGVI